MVPLVSTAAKHFLSLTWKRWWPSPFCALWDVSREVVKKLVCWKTGECLLNGICCESFHIHFYPMVESLCPTLRLYGKKMYLWISFYGHSEGFQSDILKNKGSKRRFCQQQPIEEQCLVPQRTFQWLVLKRTGLFHLCFPLALTQSIVSGHTSLGSSSPSTVIKSESCWWGSVSPVTLSCT